MTDLPSLIAQTDRQPFDRCCWNISSSQSHLWFVDLRRTSPADLSVLSDDERARALRYRFDRDRLAFQGRRVALRSLIARYENIGPESIRFHTTESGRPRAVDECGRPLIQFSSTSRDSLALIAFARVPLGVDIESVRYGTEANVVPLLHPDEAEEIMASDADNRGVRIYECWSRKEAYVKAIGLGLQVPLNHFRVSVDPEKPRLIWRSPHIDDHSEWRVLSIQTQPGYAAALVIDARCRKIDYFDYACATT